MHRRKTFFACGSSAPVRVEREGGTAAWVAGTQTATAAGLWPCQRLFFFSELLVAGDQKASLPNLSPKPRPFRHLEGSLAWGPSLLLHELGTERGTLGGVLLCSLLRQVLDRSASLLFSCLCRPVGRKRLE